MTDRSGGRWRWRWCRGWHRQRRRRRAGPDRAAAVGLRAGKLRRGRSITLRYMLSEAATVTFRLERRVRSRWVKLRGALRDTGESGANRERFTGRLAGRRLRRGTYRLVATARDAQGNSGLAARATLRVLG